MDFYALWQKAIEWLATSGIRVAVIIIAAWVGLKIAKKISMRLVDFIAGKKDDGEFQKLCQTLMGIVQHLIAFAIIVVAALTVLKEFGINIGPVLAAAGIVGLAVGFGAQSLVKDVITGFFMLLDDEIRVGDVVEVGGKGGLVEKINLRVTVLRDLSGNVHYVPNGTIGVVTNMTKEYSRYVFDVGVAYREDVDEVIAVIKALDEELRGDPEFKTDILEPIEILGLDQFADSAVVIRARTTTLPSRQWRIGREFKRRLKKRFDELDIEIPFPHVTLYMGRPKQGDESSPEISGNSSEKKTEKASMSR